MPSAFIFFLILLAQTSVLAQSPQISADPERMEQRIKAPGQLGTNPEGGVSRVAFSDADKGGISHSPKEFTSADDMANGASVLFRTVLAIDNGALE